MAKVHVFSKGEELANAITHGIGALFSIVGLVVLLVQASLYGTSWHVVSFMIFGLTMVILYMSSTIVHALPNGKAKDVFEIIDHSAIYLFIAGTYTPFTFIVIQGVLGWTLFGIVWGLAIFGTIFKAYFVKKYRFASTIFYIAMGWMVVLAWRPLIEKIAINGIVLLAIGGICYTFGALFYVWRGFKYHHAVWHLFVLGGTIAHFFCVLLYVLPL